jgi:hypothetical protein
MFQPGDVLPEVTFNIYNFKDATAQIDMLVFAAGQPAFDALDLTVTNAMAYVYSPEYTYLFETSVQTDNNIHNVYLQSVLETANPGDIYAGIMFDMARYFGALYRATSSVVTQIEYKGVVYTWDALEPNLGSNWYNGPISLVSVIVTDFMGGTLVDGVTVKLGDGTFNYYLQLTFEVTMDLDQAVIDVLEDAVTYTYTPAYTYLANSVVYEDYSMNSEYYQSVLDAANPLDPMTGIMNDMARYLGAVYRVEGSDITTIVYDGVEYTWNEALGLLGSNWSYLDESGEEPVDVTLVSVIVDDFQAMVLTDSVPLTFRNSLGHEVAVALEFAIVAEPALRTELFFSEYGEGSSNNKWLEIYNGTGAAIDLSDYSVVLYSNGSSTGGNTLTFTEGTMLADGDVYVIYNSSANEAVIAEGDVSSNVTFFNGDDAIALLKDGVVIDVIGVIGTDPGSAWTWDGGSTADRTLVRKSTVVGPVTTWDSAEWDVYPTDTFTYVGSHTIA